MSQSYLFWASLLFASGYRNSIEAQTLLEQRRALRYEEKWSGPRSDQIRAIENEEYWGVFLQAISSLPASVPTKAPTNSPSSKLIMPTPTPSNTMPGTNTPTGRCQIDLELSCMFGRDSASCKEIAAEDQLRCSCSGCAREIIFTYTGSPCNDFDGCQDIGSGPDSASRIMISNANEPTDILYIEDVSPNSQVILARSDASCLPRAMSVQLTNLQGDKILQAVSVDSSCEGGGLHLLKSYGSLDFVGYSCEVDDVHNCFIDVLYEIDTCNIGSIDQTLLSLSFELNGDTKDLVTGKTPSDGLVLGPNECYKTSEREVVEVCESGQYFARATAGGGTSLNSVITCQDVDAMKFGWEIVTMPPTAAPSLQPSSSPTGVPISQTTSPQFQTQDCSSNIELGCITSNAQDLDCVDIVEERNLVCQCSECARQLIFSYTGGSCDDYQGDPDQCLDNLETKGSARFVVTAGDNMNNIFFNGIRDLGGVIHISDVDGGCLPDTFTVTVFSTDGSNTVLQTQTIDASCDGTGYLTLMATYGSLDFVGYSCDATDVHDCFVDVLFEANACNKDNANDLILFGMEFDLNNAKDNLLGETAPRILKPEECIKYTMPSAVERCTGTQYSASLTVDSSLIMDVGEACTNTEELNFNTFSLRSSLIHSDIELVVEETFNNTQDEEKLLEIEDTSDEPSHADIIENHSSQSSCAIQAHIQCRVTDGLETQDCENIQPASIIKCPGEGVLLRSLAFNYTGKACSTVSRTSASRPLEPAHCNDYFSTGDTSSHDEEVYITIRDRDLKIYVEQAVSIGDIVHVMSPADFFEVLIEAVDENGRKQGERIQRILIDPYCRVEETSSTLTLGQDYGSLNLVSLKTDQIGLQSIFAEVEIQYFVTNPSATSELAMTSAVVSSSLTGRLGEQIIGSGAESDANKVFVASSDTATLLVERRRLNLWEEGTRAFVFAINAHASTDDKNGETECSDLETLFFRLQDIALAGK